MVFAGIQKLTLLDYPDKTACTVFTFGCDFCCPFCQNSALISKSGAEMIPESEVLEFLKSRQGLLDGVCISGGEPLLHDELEDFIDDVKSLGFLVKLDTNGSNPEKLEKLLKAGKIDFVSMDIKNTPVKYAQTIGLPAFDVSVIEKSVNILRSGTVPYEFRTTVVCEFHTGDDLLSIAQWIFGAEKYCLQRFIDSDGVLQKGLHGYSDPEMQNLLVNVKKILPFAGLRGS